MKVITEIAEFQPRPGFVAVALGNFDGVHRGHQFLIRQMVDKTKSEQGTSVVFSFQPHPLKILNKKKSLSLLSGPEDKERVISRLDVDYFLLYPFTRVTAEMHPADFVEDILIKGLRANHVFVGFNYTFGKKAAGTAELLQSICHRHDCAVTVIPPVTIEGICISSTLIRESLLKGEVAESIRLLGYHYSISGTVVHGDGIGRHMGYPTANLAPADEVLIPGNGVYAVKVETAAGLFDGVVNIGHRPTIGKDLPWTIEIHLLHQEMDLYDQHLRIYFVDRLRGEQRFASQEELAGQIKQDTARAENILQGVSQDDL